MKYCVKTPNETVVRIKHLQMKSAVVVPETTERSWRAARQEQSSHGQGIPSTERRVRLRTARYAKLIPSTERRVRVRTARYAKLIPWANLPGPVILSEYAQGVVYTMAEQIVNNLERINDELHTWGTKDDIGGLWQDTMTIQRMIFADISRLHGPRGSQINERQRYNCKAFTGPILDIIREIQPDCTLLPLHVKSKRLHMVFEMVLRMFHLNDPSLFLPRHYVEAQSAASWIDDPHESVTEDTRRSDSTPSTSYKELRMGPTERQVQRTEALPTPLPARSR